MLRLVSEVVIQQRPTKDLPNRNKVFILNFINSCTITSTWSNLTDRASLKFPKNIYWRDEHGNRGTWFKQNIISGQNPLMLRGDKITIKLGYVLEQDNHSDTPLFGSYDHNGQTFFDFNGYITRVNPRIPLEIECEDNMWILKQIKAANQIFKKAETHAMIQSLLTQANKDLIKAGKPGIDFTLKTDTTPNAPIKTFVGDFRVQNETIAQVLERFQRDYVINSYFRGEELRVSGIVYFPEDRIPHTFTFQKNIISDELEYKRKDDVKIAVKAWSTYKTQSQDVTIDDQTKVVTKRLEVFATDIDGKIQEIQEKGFDGETRTLPASNATTKAALLKLIGEHLPRYYYEGFYGTFTSFGLPFVKHGDSVIIKDNVVPERQGEYLVKSVTTTFGVDGFRRKIGLDIKINNK